MSVTFGIPIAQLERNGVAGYQPFTLADVRAPTWDASSRDAALVRSDNPLLIASNYAGSAAAGPVAGAFVGSSASGLTKYPTTGLVYHALEPADFTPLTTFSLSHPGLDPDGDANGNGESNFVDYASGADPESPVTSASLTLAAGQLVFRERSDAADVLTEPQFSVDLTMWEPLVEGDHYTVASDVVVGSERIRTFQLLPTTSTRRFFRQHFTVL
jgi:hypothetical protein